MRHFSKPTPIDRLSLEARMVYSTFCLFMLVGYLSSAWLYHDSDLGITPAKSATYYLGEPSDPQSRKPRAPAGPTLELPSEPTVSLGLRLAKPPRQVVETLHFHLFSIPVCLLILSHLFMMCSLNMRIKIGVLVVAALTSLLHILVPPLVRFIAPWFAILMFPSAVLMSITWSFMTIVPVSEMWRHPVQSTDP